MNKKIYCLVTVVSYILLVVTIQCFTNNDDLNKYVKKNRSIHDKYEMNSIDINNNEAFKYRSLSECNVEDDYTLGSSTIQEPSDNKTTEITSNIKKPKRLKFFNIFKRDNKNKKHKAPSHSKVRIPYPYDQITEAPLDYGKFLPRITITVENVTREYIPRTSKDLRYLLRMKKKLEKKIEYKSEYKSEYKPEYKSENKPENKSEYEPENKSENKSEYKSEYEPENKSENKSENNKEFLPSVEFKLRNDTYNLDPEYQYNLSLLSRYKKTRGRQPSTDKQSE